MPAGAFGVAAGVGFWFDGAIPTGVETFGAFGGARDTVGI